MEAEPDSERIYRLTAEGREHREAMVEQETDRIERERFEPPDASNLSAAARELLRQLIAEPVEVTPENRSAFRELAAARIILLGSSFARGGGIGLPLDLLGLAPAARTSGLREGGGLIRCTRCPGTKAPIAGIYR
jgi:hypothetical protein